MKRLHTLRDACRGEQGASLVELLAATSVGLSLAVLLGHTMMVYQTGYHRAVTKVGRAQQAQFALSLMADEVGVRLQAPTSATCPASGIRIADEQLEFVANLYDRSTTLEEDALAGRSEVVVETGELFEAGDLVMVVNVKTPTDPGDDVTACFRITDMNADRWTLNSPLTQTFPIGSPVALVNRVTYALDRQGRLMRTQDDGTQRVAQGVEAFDIQTDGATLMLTLTMRDLGAWTRRVVMMDPSQR